MMNLKNLIRSLLALVALGALLPQIAAAQVGHVVSVQGTALVERAGKPARILGAGEPLEQKDVINVAQASSAVLEFNDKTRVTLRPNTVFRVESYSQTAPQGMVFGLSKGGFRASTGEIGKTNPSAVRFQTDNVVLGIRGTEFDARLCDGDCGVEDRKPAVRAVARAAARLIEVTGSVTTGDGKEVSRELVAGAVLYEGETVATAAGAQALILFRDGSRVTLPESSRLAITRFDYDEGSPPKGRAHMKLVSGGAHVLTGELAKLGRDAFLFETGAGMIHTAGAGFSVGRGKAAARVTGERAHPSLQLADARGWTAGTRTDAIEMAATSTPAISTEDVFVVHTWDGTVIIQTPTERIEVPKTQTAAIAVVDGRITFLQQPPESLTQVSLRPDLASIDPSAFGQGPQPERGLYVWVHEGAVTLGQGTQVVELKAGTAAVVGQKITLLDTIPNFMRFDFTPRPGASLPPQVPKFFRGADGSVSRTCK